MAAAKLQIILEADQDDTRLILPPLALKEIPALREDQMIAARDTALSAC